MGIEIGKYIEILVYKQKTNNPDITLHSSIKEIKSARQSKQIVLKLCKIGNDIKLAAQLWLYTIVYFISCSNLKKKVTYHSTFLNLTYSISKDNFLYSSVLSLSNWMNTDSGSPTAEVYTGINDEES